MLAVDIKSTKLASTIGSYFYLKDALGSVVDVTDDSGNLIQHYAYSSFGKILKIMDNSGNDVTANPIVKTSYGFTNREHDVETGMMYYRARYMIPEIGRFIQEDPHPGKLLVPLSSINKYVYSGNNPIRFIDPDGRELFTAVLIFTLVQSIVEASFEGGSFFENLERKFRNPFSGKANEGSFYKNFALNYALFSIGGFNPGLNSQTGFKLALIGARKHLNKQEQEYGYGHRTFGDLGTAGQLNDALDVYQVGASIDSAITATQNGIREIMLSVLIGTYAPEEDLE